MSVAQDTPIIVEDDALRDGFTQIPNVILRHPAISPGAKLAYATLLSYAWGKGSCFPGQGKMARDMGVTDRSVRTYLGQLVTADLIAIRQRGLGQTNLYVIRRLPPEIFSGDFDTDGLNAENISGQDRNEASDPERKNLPTKNTQSEKIQDEKMKIDTAPLPLARHSPTGGTPPPPKIIYQEPKMTMTGERWQAYAAEARQRIAGRR